ncbi:MAG: hypothetical protein ACRC8A_02250 [Microcoleaceae cyanobacterium]
MASPIPLKSTTLVGQAHEICQLIAIVQADPSKNPKNESVIVSSNTNEVTGIKIITLQIATIAEIDTDGSIDRTAIDPFVN